MSTIVNHNPYRVDWCGRDMHFMPLKMILILDNSKFRDSHLELYGINIILSAATVTILPLTVRSEKPAGYMYDLNRYIISY